jgi:hypothetical protein
MLRFSAAASVSLFLFGSGTALAEDCSPHCDYWHSYGPYDFSYIRPGLLGYPICDRRGNCSPHLVYTYSGQRHARITITVRPVSRTPRNAREGSWPEGQRHTLALGNQAVWRMSDDPRCQERPWDVRH